VVGQTLRPWLDDVADSIGESHRAFSLDLGWPDAGHC
jgi:hypothetical protein